jgi:pimeloyl-ACP methyl ester carboxylesterase
LDIKKSLKRISLGIAGLVMLLLITGITYEYASRFVAERNFSPEGELIEVGGHSLHLLKQGNSGPTVVFESGLDSYGHLSWYKVQAEVSSFATTVSYDRAGVLWSERGDSPKTGEAMAEDLKALLEKGHLTKPYIIVGHSIAGITLRTFIAKNADDIAGIILVDATHPDQMNRFPPELKQMMQPPARWMLNLMVSFGMIRFNSDSDFPNTDSEARINTVASAIIHKSLGAVIDELENIELLTKEASKVSSFGDIPIVIITGTSATRNNDMPQEFREDMRIIWNELQEELLMLSTDSKHILATGSGHYVQLDQPEIVIRAIKELVEKTN